MIHYADEFAQDTGMKYVSKKNLLSFSYERTTLNDENASNCLASFKSVSLQLFLRCI